MKTYPLTVGMTPAFFYEGDWLLRAQLRCLSEQAFKDFDVHLADPHYEKRHGYMDELAEKYKLNLVHYPYRPNLQVAKKLDIAVFNTPYLFSESPKIVRYSCWRFVRPDFTQACVDAKHAIDFYFHNFEAPTRDSMHLVTNHDARIWDMRSDEVKWDLMPKKGGDPGASWTSHSDRDAPLAVFPLNCYGNYMVPRDDWFRVNGCDEAIFNSEHWEDQDFCNRANRAGIKCERKAHMMYRAHHIYGSHSGRANILPDWGKFMEPCEKCQAVEHKPKPDRRDLKRRIANGELLTFGFNRTWVCKTCYYCGPIFHADEAEYWKVLDTYHYTRSNILPMVKLGRNLEILAQDMNGKNLGTKVEMFNNSWTNAKYFQP